MFLQVFRCMDRLLPRPAASLQRSHCDTAALHTAGWGGDVVHPLPPQLSTHTGSAIRLKQLLFEHKINVFQ